MGSDRIGTRVLVDFNEYYRDQMAALYPEHCDGPVSPGDRVIMYDGEELECDAVVDAIRNHGRGALVYMTPLRDTMRRAESASSRHG